LKIGIDFHVVDGIFQGSRTYLIELFSRAFQMAPEHEFYLFLDNPDVLALCGDAFSRPNVKAVRMPHANPAKRLCLQLPALQKRYSLDLLHVQYVMPVPSLCPVVATIHDILFESHPQFFKKTFTLRSKLLVRRTALKARHIFTCSRYSGQEIINRYGVDKNKVSVIPYGADMKKFFPGNAGGDVLKKYGIKPKGYILTVGRLEPRKNHVSVIRAYSSLKDAPPLVVVGQPDFSFRQIHAEVEAAGIKDRVIFLSGIGDNELPAFYRNALFFAYPSWAEGFGIPPLEAFASGTPVISSNTTALAELSDGAALSVDPGDIEGLAKSMQALLSDSGMRADLAARGLKRAGEFSWTRAAERTLEGYRKACV